MDPNLFHVDWDRVTEVLAAVVVVAMMLERALALVFESRAFIGSPLDKPGVREFVAFAAAFAVCRAWDFDALSSVLLTEKTRLGGHLVTAGVIAGGAKGSVKLFRDVLGFQSTAHEQRNQIRAQKLAVRNAAKPATGATPSTMMPPPMSGQG